MGLLTASASSACAASPASPPPRNRFRYLATLRVHPLIHRGPRYDLPPPSHWCPSRRPSYHRCRCGCTRPRAAHRDQGQATTHRTVVRSLPRLPSRAPAYRVLPIPHIPPSPQAAAHPGTVARTRHPRCATRCRARQRCGGTRKRQAKGAGVSRGHAVAGSWRRGEAAPGSGQAYRARGCPRRRRKRQRVCWALARLRPVGALEELGAQRLVTPAGVPCPCGDGAGHPYDGCGRHRREEHHGRE